MGTSSMETVATITNDDLAESEKQSIPESGDEKDDSKAASITDCCPHLPNDQVILVDYPEGGLRAWGVVLGA